MPPVPFAMTPTRLRSKSLGALRELAVKLGLRIHAKLKKEDLVTRLARAGRRVASKPACSAVAVGVSRRRGVRNPSLGRLAPSPKRRKKTATKAASARRGAKPTEASSSGAPLAVEVAHKFDLPRHPIPQGARSPHDHLGELPDAYGTGLLFLVARDPYWLYAAWDFTSSQMRAMRRAARHGEMRLRVDAGEGGALGICRDIALHPMARDWYFKVDHASTEYRGELGYWDAEGRFVVVARSAPTRTPPDAPSPRVEAHFATIPFGMPFRRLRELAEARRRPGEAWMEAISRLQAEGHAFPFPVGAERPWSGEQAQRLTERVQAAAAHDAPPSSEEAAARRADKGWRRPTSSGEGFARSR